MFLFITFSGLIFYPAPEQVRYRMYFIKIKEDLMKNSKAVKICTGCPLCRFTRNAVKETFLYKIARSVQKICPTCSGANKALDKDFQKGRF